MTLEEIESLWLSDSKINEFKLATEALNIPQLHAKYYQIYVREKLTYSKLKEQEKELENILSGFYAKTLTDQELENYGLEYNDKKVLRQDIPKAVECHPDMIKFKLKMAMAFEKVEFLKSILSMIGGRSFQIRDAIEFKKFEAGA